VHLTMPASNSQGFRPRQEFVSWIGLILLLLAMSGCQGDGTLQSLPEIDTSAFLPAVREQVEEALRKAQQNSNDAEAVGRLGMVLHAHEQYAGAAQAYQRAIGLSDRNIDWQYYLAIVQADTGEREASLATINAVLKLDARMVAARHLKADLLLEGNEWQQAVTILEDLLDKNPRDARALYQLGRAQLGMEKLEEATKSLQQACELFPSYGAAHYALAGTYRRLGDKHQASNHLRSYELYRGIEAPIDDPLWDKVSQLNMSPQAHIRRAMQLEARGDLEQAAIANERAIEQDPSLVQAYVNLVSLYGRTNQFEKATERFRQGLNLNPNRDDLYYNYGVLRFNQGATRDAKIAFERALAINPYHAGSQTNIGYILQTEGRVKESIGMLEKAVQNAPNSRVARFHLSRGLINVGRLRDAIPHLEQTLEPEDVETSTYMYALAATHARLRNKQEALRYAYQAREMASSRGQSRLLESIQRDIVKMEAMKP
jgi:tetratricopeptide (TPR) repeat protein